MLFASWNVLCQLAPWLLLGMLLSGVFHVVLPAGFIKRRFQGMSGILQSVAFGVPLPLCSCGVVPAGIGLKNDGASDGASVGFLISTPQTGVDSVLVSASFFGWPFAIFKMVSALIMGVVGGVLADKVGAGETDADGTPDLQEQNADDSKSFKVGKRNWLFEIVVHSVEILRSIWVWLVVGILASAAIQVWVPQTWFTELGNLGLLSSMLVVLLVSVPLYVCATASVPIAAAMVSSGLPPAAALVFLMAGPATNTTTIGAIFGRFGLKVLFIYLATIILGSLSLAWMFDGLVVGTATDAEAHHHGGHWFATLSASLILIQMIWFCFEIVRRKLNRVGAVSPELQKEFAISGMTCQGCVGKLERAIANAKNVDSVRVQLKPPSAFVAGAFSDEEIVSVAKDAGFVASRENCLS